VSGGWLFDVLCIVAAAAAVIGLIRVRLRVGRLPGLASVPGSRRRGRGDFDANPREAEADDGDDGDDDGGDGDGGDA
jgi:hypothetical protein